ncbi:MAG: adenylyltransferase/cytidyltransferase family protein [Verrucomicrobia bacterium]|nr:adenylyltransferase/cytidyltransferase family protein [Verrucomicrobiota bacterium]
MKRIAVCASFDDLRSPYVRFLEEAAKLGEVHVLLWSDDVVRAVTGKDPKFPEAERFYLLQAIRYVEAVRLVKHDLSLDALPLLEEIRPDVWAVDEPHDSPAKREFCDMHRLAYHVVSSRSFAGYPKLDLAIVPPAPGSKKVIVTGCYDWFHSGHVRFFEEVSEYGDLYVTVGNDKTIGELKGPDHPLFKEDERRYLCGSIRYVHQSLISTGMGWLDAAPEIARIKPDIYAVNEDGDRPEKRDFCAEHGIQYLVLKRTPKEGLTRRSSTSLRGF